MLDGMSDSIQGSRIENLHSREVDRQSPTGLIFIITITFSYILTTEITAPVSASVQSDAGRRYYFGPYRLSISSKQLRNIDNSKIFY